MSVTHFRPRSHIRSVIHSFSHSFIQAERSRFYEVLSGLKLKVGVGGM